MVVFGATDCIMCVERARGPEGITLFPQGWRWGFWQAVPDHHPPTPSLYPTTPIPPTSHPQSNINEIRASQGCPPSWEHQQHWGELQGCCRRMAFTHDYVRVHDPSITISYTMIIVHEMSLSVCMVFIFPAVWSACFHLGKRHQTLPFTYTSPCGCVICT